GGPKSGEGPAPAGGRRWGRGGAAGGPAEPSRVIEQRTRRGACRSTQASAKPHFSSVPNLKLSISTSAFAIRSARIFCPEGTAMLSVNERLLRLTPRK